MSGERILLSIVGCLLSSASLTDAVAQSGDPSLDDGLGTPLFTVVPLNATPPTDNTIPHWTSSFTSSQVTYPFSMVGTNPELGNATTIVPVAIIPVMFVFADGQSLDGTASVPDVLASPIFQNFSYTSGTTQFGDAILRAQFWPIISTTSPDWHVLLR